MDLEGREVGNYRILRKLGEGGMGAVYEAVHPTIHRRIAIKVIRPELAANEEIVARFLREARAANSVRHPGLVEVLDLGQLADGTLYLVMELLEGESLGQRLERGQPLALGEALDVLDACAGPLQALHDAGMVHRDLKPDNIFLLANPIVSPIKILDFGLVKLLAATDGAKSVAGTLRGTPMFMAPEQCAGSAVDARTDIYAMGCVAFQMLTGRPPFWSDQLAHVLVMHMTAAPPSLRQLRPDTPHAIAVAIERALAKRPLDRFASITDFSCALRKAVAVPASHTRAWRSRGLAVIAAAGIAVGLTLAFRSRHHTRDAAPPMAVARSDAGDVARRADAGLRVNGVQLWLGRGVERDPASAFTAFASECRADNSIACENALHVSEHAAIADGPSELRALGTACPTHAGACVARARQSRDAVSAQLACEARVPTGCLIAALVDDDPRRAEAAADLLANDAYLDAHYLRGFSLAFGIGTTRDPTRATRELEVGCAAGDPAACALAQCLAPDRSADARMRALDLCGAHGALPDYLVELGKAALVREVMTKPRPR